MRIVLGAFVVLISFGHIFSSVEPSSATPYLQIAPIFPDGASILGFGINIPINGWFGITSNFGSNISGQLGSANYIDNHLDLGFYGLKSLDGSSLIVRISGGIYKLNHLKKFNGEYYGAEYDYPYEGRTKGTWTNGGISVGFGFKADTGLLSITIIPTGHLVFDTGSKIVNKVQNNMDFGDTWLAHPYNTSFIEVPIEIGVNIR